LALLLAGDGSLTAGGGEQPRTVSWCAAPIPTWPCGQYVLSS